MGIETEYAFSVVPRQGQFLDRQDLLHRMLGAVRERFPSIPDLYTGMFLPNGARLYIDTGLHPEFATPECVNPEETVAYILAGDRILKDIAVSLEQGSADIKEVLLFRTNVDYGGTYATWGCHESYLHSADPSVLAAQIIPHLVSRLIYTGAGGFNPLSKGLDFSISPRVAHLKHVASAESTQNRGIFHTKNETLASKGFNRLHILCGESLCSQTATWLKIGTTALVVAMIEAGVCQADAVRPSSPLQAMQSFAADPACRAVAMLTSGRCVTAIDIQRHYLSRAEACLGADFMPDWAERVCNSWRRVLDALSAAPESLDKTLDWAIKHAVFAGSADRLGLDWDLIPRWSYVATRLKEALAKTEYRDRPVTAEFVLGESSPVRKEVEALTPHLKEAGLNWHDLVRYAQVKWRLCEIDLRFGQLSEESIFEVLDRAGVLAHRLDGMRETSTAVNEPPTAGRARLRGNFVRRHGTGNGHYYCDWQGVWDHRKKRVLDLSNPFETEERWRDFSQTEAQWPWPGTGIPRQFHRRFGMV